MLRLEPSPRRAASQDNMLDTPEATPRQLRFDNLPRPPPPQYPPPPPPNTRPFKPVIVEEHWKNQVEGDSRPFTKLRPQNGIRLVPLIESNKQSEPLDQSFDYGDSLYSRINDEDANTSIEEPQNPPALPSRNVVSRSQELLSNPLAMHNKEDAGRKHLVNPQQRMPGSREELSILGTPPHIAGNSDVTVFGSRDGVRRVRDDPSSRINPHPHPAPRNRDILNQLTQTLTEDPSKPFPVSRVQEGHTQASPKSGSREAVSPGSSEPIFQNPGRSEPVSLTNGSRELNGEGRTRSPALTQSSVKSHSREGMNIGSPEPISLMQRREMNGESRKQSPAPTIASPRSGSGEELNGERTAEPPLLGSGNRMIPATKGTRRPSKTPSVSSNSTLYQPADAGKQYPTRTAYIVAPYDDPGFQARQQPSSSHQTPSNKSNSQIAARTSSQTGAQTQSPLARGLDKQQTPLTVPLPGLQAPQIKSSHITPRTAQASKTSQHSPFTQTPDKVTSPQASTRLGFHDSSQHPSHSLSMDHLDGPMDIQWPELSPDHRPPVISMAKSLSSLLDSSSSSMRSYGQPTLL